MARRVFLPDRLEGVRQHEENRWTARCPAHADKSPSLSVTRTKDGMWLLHCFAGCSPVEVLAAIGVRMTDLFPESSPDHRPRGAFKLSPSQAMQILDAETQLVYLAAGELRQGKPLSGPDHRRLEEAVVRIRTVMEYGRTL